MTTESMRSPSWLAALRLARSRSYGDGRLRFVQADSTTGVIAISLRRDKTRPALWTNGSQCGVWYKGESKGVAEETLTQD